MSLRLKMVMQIALTLAALLTVGAAALWGINGLHADYGSAIGGYEELRQVYDAASHVQIALTLLGMEDPEPHTVMRQVQGAAERFELIKGGQGTVDGQMTQLRQSLQHELAEAQSELWAAMTATPPHSPRIVAPRLQRGLSLIANMGAQIRKDIQARQEAAGNKRQATRLMMIAIAAVAALAVIGLGLVQYWSVMRPLKRLGKSVRQVAQGKLDERVQPVGPSEFAALARDFNVMAQELDELYRQLEEKVAAKSRELVRSERLASVGFLAAGVAHEINNPIGIIAGYAELSLKELDGSRNGNAIEEARKSLLVISEEAFRCKEIVRRLLELSRPGEENRAPFSLGEIATSVASTIAGLNNYQDRKLELEIDRPADLLVTCSEGEMKQVVLNLVINALEATSPRDGKVVVRVNRRNQDVELSVCDNGKGMTAQVLERIFEPFFTAKRGASAPGTGLGLSITHAIVENHGGRIVAQSAGPGQGSLFTVTLPAAAGAVV